jgi:hypothetical protein
MYFKVKFEIQAKLLNLLVSFAFIFKELCSESTILNSNNVSYFIKMNKGV